ncbi:class I SAM-dependent methyltransferase [Limobrevibacterium gyesilva]|uniref:Class I SAM-dependent methyltransferase n=1 Tax=Limobrevibacterium gyesilva TaxID=2991712 RepID=A0AA42CHL4_9PROT|nr:class I SAM-dependent methyltransferase [Limobrevibacterium gyesilva]MCW3474995.1 class I SAM-dependent methyltransferase [Limobrevibacterium gyesilva]
MNPRTPNSQYNLAAPDSLSVRVATAVRGRMFDLFMQTLAPAPDETVLDLGVTSDQTYTSSNYFEALYPHKDRITAAGIDDAQFLEVMYPGVRFVHADALDLPFADGQFDLVHSSAVLEHVGSFENQARMVAECLRVARRGVFLTTPNRWFPIEFHTQLPLVHWLPKPMCRAVFRRTGYGFFADEANLNLMSARELMRIAARHPAWSIGCRTARLLGWPSNLLMIGTRAD